MGTGASAAVVVWLLWGGRASPRAAKTYATEWGVFVLEQARPREGTLLGFDFDESRRMVYERDQAANNLC